MVDFELPEIFEASISIYSETTIKKAEESEETLPFQETRNFNFYLGNLGTSNEEKLMTARRILDELAEEICHLTGFGVQKSQMTTVHDARKYILIDNTYTQFHPVGNHVFEFALVLDTDCSFGSVSQIVLPYHDRYWGDYLNKFPKDRFRPQEWYYIGEERSLQRIQELYAYTRSFQPDGIFYYHQDHRGTYHFNNFHDPLFQRFLRKIVHPIDGVIYYYYYQEDQQQYLRYRKIDRVAIKVLPRNRRSLLLQGKQKVQRTLKAFRAKKAKEEQRLRKQQGKTPISEKVYLIHLHENIYKIGVSTRPKIRLRSLQTSNPHMLTLLHIFPADDGKAAEGKLHAFFYTQRLEGEWFQLDESHIHLLQRITAYKHGRFYADTELVELKAMDE